MAPAGTRALNRRFKPAGLKTMTADIYSNHDDIDSIISKLSITDQDVLKAYIENLEAANAYLQTENDLLKQHQKQQEKAKDLPSMQRYTTSTPSSLLNNTAASSSTRHSMIMTKTTTNQDTTQQQNISISKSFLESADEAIHLFGNSVLFQKVQSVFKSGGNYTATKTRSEQGLTAETRTEQNNTVSFPTNDELRDDSDLDDGDDMSTKSLLESADEAILSLGEITGNQAVYMIESARSSLNLFVEEYNDLVARTKN